MRRRGRGLGIGALGLVVLLAACGRFGDGERPDGLQIRFEDRAEPEAFTREGTAVRDTPDGAPGLWVAVRDLPRPERAEVVNLRNRRKTEVALFAARGSDPEIRLSNEVADLLVVTDAPARVRITALRREPQIDTTGGRF